MRDVYFLLTVTFAVTFAACWVQPAPVATIEQHTTPCVLEPGAPGTPDEDVLCSDADWPQIQTETDIEFHRHYTGGTIWQALSCYDSITAHNCDIGWTDGYNDFLTKCYMYFNEPGVIRCNTLLYR